MIDTTSTRNAASVADIALSEKLRHVSWGSILVGLAIAVAVQILLGVLGIGLGLTIVDPTDPMGGIGAWSIATSIYMVITMIIALFIGGYVASHLAPSLTDRTAMFHGLSIWALATIVMVWLGTTAVGSVISGASSAVSGIASVTGQAMKTVVPENLSLPDISFNSLPQGIQDRLRENGITPSNLRDEMQGAYRDVISPQEERRLMQELEQAVQSAFQNPTEAAAIIQRAVEDMIGGPEGILNEQDLNEMRNSLQSRLNLSDQETQEIMTQLEQGVANARDTLGQTIKQTQQAALESADAVAARVGSVALWLFVGSVLGLIAAVIGGRLGEVKAGNLTRR